MTHWTETQLNKHTQKTSIKAVEAKKKQVPAKGKIMQGQAVSVSEAGKFGEGWVIIGIDPGTKTGIAIADTTEKRLIDVKAVQIHRALCILREYHDKGSLKVVYIEDSRNVSRVKNSAAMAQGAGSIKRDCSILEDFCVDYGIPFTFIRPSKKSMLKMSKEWLKQQTGWDKVTSQHARDAVGLIIGRY